jgi:hypothetical protein
MYMAENIEVLGLGAPVKPWSRRQRPVASPPGLTFRPHSSFQSVILRARATAACGNPPRGHLSATPAGTTLRCSDGSFQLDELPFRRTGEKQAGLMRRAAAGSGVGGALVWPSWHEGPAGIQNETSNIGLKLAAGSGALGQDKRRPGSPAAA